MGSLGGSKQSAASRQQQGYATGYSMYQPGVNPIEAYGPQKQSNLSMGAYQGWMDADKDYQARQSEGNGFMEMLMAMMEGMGGAPQMQMGPSYEDQQAEYNRRMEEQRRQQGIKDTQTAYTNYLNAATSATDYINAEIAKEQSNAALLGVDYAITDEIKQQRIENYFATVWGEGDQLQLETLGKQWGMPGELTLKRGDASAYSKSPATGEKVVATSKGMKNPLLDEEEEAAKGNLLGI